MTSSIIRGRHVVCRVDPDGHPVIIDDGAVFQRDGRIVEIGPFAEISRKHESDLTVGSGDDVVLPGLVNSHHHLGITPFQHGVPDLPLELWLAARIGMRDVDPYLDTLYSAFEMIVSGVTTVQHLHGRGPPPLAHMHASAKAVIRAYEAVGMRASYSYGIRDQNRLVYGDDGAFAASLPPPLAERFRGWLRDQVTPVEDCVALFEMLHAEYRSSERIRIQLAPVNLQWCSDQTLERVRDLSERHDVPIHMHLLETPYQKEYADKRTRGIGAVAHLDRLGMLGPRLTLGHAVWLAESEIVRLAETGTCVCHNCSSNMRLQTGRAPVNALLAAGVPVAIGIDEAGINDDRDMIQEMRLVMSAHRDPGHQPTGPGAAETLRMATEHGARTTPFGAHIGTLEPGKAADMALVSMRAFAHPYLDERVPILDAVLRRTRSGGVSTVIVAGEVIYDNGRFTRVDRDAALAELSAALRAPLRDGEHARRETSAELMPHVRRFYEGYRPVPDRR
jgi:cytosine/adenosine deaminase-related metal-dependent hydrolase